jgi:hypothetical protein
MVDEHHNIAIYIIGKLPTTYGFCRAASFSTLFFKDMKPTKIRV